MKNKISTTIAKAEPKALTFAQKRLATRFFKIYGLMHYPFVLLHEFSHAFFLLIGGIRVDEIKINICRADKINGCVIVDSDTINNLWRIKCAIISFIAPLISLILLLSLAILSKNSLFIYIVVINSFCLLPSKSDWTMFKEYKRKHHLLKLLKK